jgi:hypothetical protein
MRRTLRALPLLVAVLVMPSAASAAATTTAAASPRAGSAVAIVGGTAAQRRLARLVALRVGGVTLRRVVFFRSPSPVFRPWHVHGSELEVLSSPELAHGLLLRSEWEQELFIGTYLALAERDPKAAVAAVATADSAAPADRAAVYDGSGKPPTAAAVARQIGLLLNAAGQRGAQVVEARTISLPTRAIAITLKVSDPAAFLKHRAASFLALLYRPRIPLLGYYVGVEDGSGRVVWATSRLPNEGAVYAIPRLDACSPVSHSEPVGATQPPCPAP